MKLHRLYTSGDLARYAESLERQGVKPNYQQLRADWESACSQHFWRSFDIAAGIVVVVAVAAPSLAALLALVVLLAAFLLWMQLAERIYL